MKKLFTLLTLIITISILSLSAATAIDISDFKNFELDNDLGYVEDTDHVTINIVKGWNMLPLKVISEGAGYKWKEEHTCEDAMYENVWAYSPVLKDYTSFSIMDWNRPKSRGNQVILPEFQNNYYHMYMGSGWIYSRIDCQMVGESGTGMLSQTYLNDLEDLEYKYDDLVLKAGWNFFALDGQMVFSEKSLNDIFDGCGLEKATMWNNKEQKWLPIIRDDELKEEFKNDVYTDDIFKTFVIKTSKDCRPAKNVFDGPRISAPPAIPSEDNQNSVIVNKCELTHGMDCMDFSVTADSVQLYIVNNLGYDVKDVLLTVSGCDDTTTISNWNNKENQLFNLNCQLGNTGDTYNEEIKLQYTSVQTGMKHVKTGTISGTI